jgi:LacI family transcriptional regulator
MKTPGRASTIDDVAAHAGVSKASVSRVLNGKQNVDPGIVALVQKAVQELSYRPSLTARSLAYGRNDTVAMVVPDLENPLFQGILKGLSVAAAVDGYRVLVADTVERAADEAEIALEARRRCDAIVLCAPRMPEDELLSIAERLAPVVIVNRRIPDTEVPTVGVDYAGGMRQLVSHFASLGHRRVLYLAGPQASSSNADRIRGLRQAAASLPDLDVEVIACGSRLDDGNDVAPLVAEKVRTGITGVLAFNDLVALGLLPRLAALGVNVPGCVSVAGFDDIPLARFSVPTLTSVSVPRAELGAQVWAHMRDLIAGVPVRGGALHAAHLEPRGSTAQAPVPR